MDEHHERGPKVPVYFDPKAFRKARAKTRQTQKGLAGLSGMSIDTIGRAENGQIISQESALEICGAFNDVGVEPPPILSKDDNTPDIFSSRIEEIGKDEFEPQISKTKNQLDPPLIKPRSNFPAYLAGCAILILFVIAVWWWLIPPSLTISEIRVFDDSYRAGPDGSRWITALHRRSHYFEIGNANEFLLPLGFVISGYAVRADGGISIKIELEGLPKNPEPVWHTHHSLSRVDDWNNLELFIAFKGISAEDVLREFGLKGGTAIPIVTMVQCAQPDELVPWSGKIEISVTDEIAHRTATANLTLDLKKPKDFGRGYDCH